MMTPDRLLLIAGLLMALSHIALPILGLAFCVPPAPERLRALRDVAVALAGARIAAGRITVWPIDYPTALVFLAIGVTGLIMALWNLRRGWGADGDRCGRNGMVNSQLVDQ